MSELISFFAWHLGWVLTAHIAVIGATAIHCALKCPTENKTAWTLIVIFVPVLGWLGYWIFRESSDLSPRVSAIPPPAPPRNIAAEVSAALEADSKRRRGL